MAAILAFFFPTWSTSWPGPWPRSEEHTSELQSHDNLVCRLLPAKISHDLRESCVSRRLLCAALIPIFTFPLISMSHSLCFFEWCQTPAPLFLPLTLARPL